MLLGIVRVVRSIVDNARQEDASGIVNLILRCCANALLSAVDFLNKFTINFAAITGEAYCSAARMTYELLKRNLLSAVFVETVSTRILSGIILVLSAIYAILVSCSPFIESLNIQVMVIKSNISTVTYVLLNLFGNNFHISASVLELIVCNSLVIV